MIDDPPAGYGARLCAVCGVRYADHFAIPSAPFEAGHLHFIERPGDEWCGWCDDWAVNCHCFEEDTHD